MQSNKSSNLIIVILLIFSLGCNNVKSNNNESNKVDNQTESAISRKEIGDQQAFRQVNKLEKDSMKSIKKESQEEKEDAFFDDSLKLFANISRFDEKTQNIFKEKGFKEYALITTKRIDPDGNERINKETIKSYIEKRFPNKGAEEILIIDWEQRKYKDLKKPEKSQEFKAAEKEFKKLVNYIKELRPNLVVGIYGLPYRVFNNKYPHYAKKNKFLGLLKAVDIITPSLYGESTDSERSKNENDVFLKNTIELSIEYADQLGKPLYFFIWEMTSSKENRLLPVEEFRRKIETIVAYQSKNKWVQGVIYWTPAKANYYLNEMKASASQGITKANSTDKDPESFRNTVISNYLSEVF